MGLRVLLWTALIGTGGCRPPDVAYPPPLQRSFDPNSEPSAVGERIAMESPQADSYIVSGTVANEPGAPWRWCGPKLEMRFQLTSTQGLKFYMDFVINETTFRTTGPVTMRFHIDGKPIGEARYEKHGSQHFETAADPKLLRSDAPMVVSAEADKFLTGDDGVRLAFLIAGAGFKP